MDVLTILMVVIGGTSLLAWNKPELMEKLIFNPYTVDQRKEYHRFITSGFIHSNIPHLGFNLYVLYTFGQAIEIAFGQIFGEYWAIHFLLLFGLGVIVSSIPTFIKNRTAPYYNSLGASGGVASVVFAFIFLFPKTKLSFLFIPFGFPAILYGVGYLAYSTYQDKQNNDNINHSAHLWGSIFGIVYLLCLKPHLIFHFINEVTNW